MNSSRCRLAWLLLGLGACSALPPTPPRSTEPARAVAARIETRADDYVLGLLDADVEFHTQLEVARTVWRDHPQALAVLDEAAGYWDTMGRRFGEFRLTRAPAPHVKLRDLRLVQKSALLRCAEAVDAPLPDGADPLPATVADLIGVEEKVFVATLQEPLKDDYIAAQVVRSDLFRRKYFEDATTQGNFLEAWLNGSLGLFRSTDLGTVAEPGVSPWEALARFEPAVTVGGEERQLALGSLGLLHHFFPDYAPSGHDPRATESLWSQWVQRVGVRVAAGAAITDTGGADFVFGAGLQVRSFTVWGIWNPEQDDFSLAIGLNDLAFLRDALPTFGL
jgi:hypothetical protein